MGGTEKEHQKTQRRSDKEWRSSIPSLLSGKEGKRLARRPQRQHHGHMPAVRVRASSTGETVLTQSGKQGISSSSQRPVIITTSNLEAKFELVSTR